MGEAPFCASACALDDIVSIHPPGEARIFTLASARILFPLVRRITAESATELNPISRRLREAFTLKNDVASLEQAYESVVRNWVAKMERLGLVVKGLWLVDFDTGDGYLCWRFPEEDLAHYHPYHKGFTGRRPLAEIIALKQPEWARGA